MTRWSPVPGSRVRVTGDGPKAIFSGAVAWLRTRRVLPPQGVTTLERLVAPLAEPIRSGPFTTEDLLTLAPGDAVAEVWSLYQLALAELADFLSATTPVAVLGPTFSASKLCAADADLIVDGVLIEVKTRPGAANRYDDTERTVTRVRDLLTDIVDRQLVADVPSRFLRG
ncbi:hypothetical protein [Nocardia niigatensis]